MKILIISQYFYPENFRINDFAFSLVKKGHDVIVLSGLPNYPNGRFFGKYSVFKNELINGVKVVRVPLIPRFKSKGWQLGMNYLSFLFSSLLFGPLLLRNYRFDVIFTASYSPATVGIIGVFFSRLKNAKMALWVQDLWPQSLSAAGAIRSKSILNFFRSMVNWVYKRSDLILVQSKAFIKEIEKYDISNEKIHFFPNWAEDLYKKTSTIDKGLRNLIPDNSFIIMFAGNLGKAQSLDTIAEAALLTKKNNIHWVLIGDGRERLSLEQKISEFKIENITLLGSFPMEKMPIFFSMSDALLVTLKNDPIFSATIPGKLQSYMLSKKPIIASLDGEGAKVINDSRCGFFVPSEDSKGLSKKAIELSQLKENERELMGIRGREYYDKHFDREMLIEKFQRILVQDIKQ
ncbi:MAG: glycosyltransferase family 4 protein [Gammaproteobacteria bacterium]|nr:glycosyltransferase family 4 protein [Gammaproteobacteria bacterium]